MLKLVTICIILNTHISYLTEVETVPGKKTCISEVFPENEPISIEARVTEKYRDRYNLYLTIEDEKKLLLAHKKYKPEDEITLLTYNNKKNESLSICIDNFENYIIPVELNIKFSHHLATTDEHPLFTEYDEINNKLDYIVEKLKKSHNYYKQNEIYTKRILRRSSNFDWSLNLVGFLSLGVIVAVGVLQIFVVKRDVVCKKNW